MGVRILEGTADGSTPAAAMYCSTSGWMVGPIFEGAEAAEQAAGFLRWLAGAPYLRAEILDELGLVTADLPDLRQAGTDPRVWPDSGLEKLVTYWRSRHVDADGYLVEAGVTA